MFSQKSSETSAVRTRPRVRPGIFARVYAFDLLLAGLAIAACVAMTRYIIDDQLKGTVHSVSQWMVHEAFDMGKGRYRDGLLFRLYESGRVRMTLYDADGRFLAAGGPVFPLPEADRLSKLRHDRIEGFTGEDARLSVAVYQDSVFLGYGFVAPADPLSIGFGMIHAILVLGTIALVAWPLANSLLKPLRELSVAMGRFRAGDLSSRVARPGNDEIGELARGFNRLAAKVQELLQSEKMLLAAVSHELRTPLQRVRLALELAMDAGEGPEGGDGGRDEPRRLAGISADLNDLDELLSEILVVARLDQARTASDRLLTKQPIPPDELISECVERFEAAHPERTIRWLEGPPLPLSEMDPRFVRRAVLNLLENAVRYSPSAEPVEIASWADASQLVIEVTDRGPGIPAELHSRIFEPFFQGDASRGGSSGSGLGLSIVQRIAEAHGGKVGVISSKSGSTFRITLPLV